MDVISGRGGWCTHIGKIAFTDFFNEDLLSMIFSGRAVVFKKKDARKQN